MTQAVQHPLPSQHNSVDANGGSHDLIFHNLFGFVPASYRAPAPTSAPPTVKRRVKGKQPEELVGRSVKKLFADGKRYRGTVRAHDVDTRRVVVAYEDGDEEQMTVAALKHFLVPDVPEDPLAGRRKAPTPASQSRTAPSVPQSPPADGVRASATQPVPDSQPRDTAVNDAEAAATMASWAPGCARLGGDAATTPPQPPPRPSQAAGLPAQPAAIPAPEAKLSAQSVPVAEQATAEQPAPPSSVPPLPQVGSSPETGDLQVQAPGQLGQARGVVVADVVGDSSAAEDSLRHTTAAPPDGGAASPSGKRRKMAAPRRVTADAVEAAAPQGLGSAGLPPPPGGKRTVGAGASQPLPGFGAAPDAYFPLAALRHLFGRPVEPAVPAVGAAVAAASDPAVAEPTATDPTDGAEAAEPAGTVPDDAKTCSRCGVARSPSDFWRNVVEEDGLQRMCIPCHRDTRVSKSRSGGARATGKRRRTRAAAGGDADETGVESLAKVLKPAGAGAADAVGAPERTDASAADSADMKTCSGCKLMKPKAEFWKHARNPGGVQSRCKACLRPRVRKVDESASRDGKMLEAVGLADGDSPAPSVLPAFTAAAHEDSPLAALATAAVSGGPADFEVIGNQQDASAPATASLLRRSGRTAEAGADSAGVAAPPSRKRAAEAAPVAEEGPPQKRAAAANEQLAASAAATTTGGHNGKTQRCTRCLQTKPLDAFYKASRAASGHHSRCKACFALYRARPSTTAPIAAPESATTGTSRPTAPWPPAAAITQGGATCATCKQLKPRKSFYPAPHQPTGVSLTCRTCHLKAGHIARSAARAAGVAKLAPTESQAALLDPASAAPKPAPARPVPAASKATSSKPNAAAPVRPQAAAAASAGAGPSSAVPPGVAPQGGLAPMHKFRRADVVHKAPHIMRPVGVGIGRREPVFRAPVPTAAEGRRRGLTADGALPGGAGAEAAVASDAGQAVIDRNNALIDAKIVWQLKTEQLREQQRDWEAEGRRLAVQQAAYKAEMARLDREQNELAKAWRKLSGVTKR